MKIKNYQVKSLIDLLSSLTLKGKESRMRTKFLQHLTEHFNNYILHNLNELYKEYSIKDDDGEIIFKDEAKTKFDVQVDFFEEEQILLNEEYIFELNDFNKMVLLSISEILLEGDFDVSGEIAKFYDEWCEQAEKIIEHYQDKESE